MKKARFPELLEEIEKRRKDAGKGSVRPDQESPDYKDEVQKEAQKGATFQTFDQ